MSKLHINIGNSANDRAGDPLRLAFDKVNQNFDELYANLTSYLPNPTGSSGKFLSTNGTDLVWVSTVKFVQSNTAPTGNNSTLWYDQISGRIYTWYSNAWIDASPPTVDYKLDPPTSPQGAIGDVEGNWSGDFNYYYYCGANYTGNNAPIWRRVAFDSSNNWNIYNGNGGGASLPANAVGYLYNNGSGTITWTPNTQGYTLPQATASVLGGVRVDGVTIVANNGIISSAPQINADWDSSSGPSAILNKPTIPAAQVQSDWTVTDNTRLSFIKNKPSIPSINNFEFSANQITVTNNGAIRLLTNTHSWSFNSNGSLTYPDNSVQVTAYTGTTWPSQVGQGGKFLTTDGNVLSWTTVIGGAGGSSDRLTNNGKEVVLNSSGLLTVPGNVAGSSGALDLNYDGSVVLSGIPTVNAVIQTTTISNNTSTWTFDTSGDLTMPSSGAVLQNYSYTKTTTANLNTTSSVIWTSLNDSISSVKLLIQLETNEVGDASGWHSQVCEAVIASRGYAQSANGPLGDPAMSVYGLVYTSTAPLVTFTVQRNSTTKLIELVGTVTAATTGNPTMRIHSVEMSTRD